MKISTLAKLSLVGLIFIYSSKLADTLNHGIFRPKAFAGAIVGTNILSGLAQLLFFIALYRHFSPLIQNKMMKAITLAIIGSAIALLPKFLAMALLFQNQSLLFFLRPGNLIGAFCPWLSAFLLFSFCSIALCESDIRQNIGLKKAFTAGFLGW